MKFQNPSMHKIWHASDFILIFSKGHNFRKGDNSGKKKRVSAILHEDYTYKISKP